MKIEDIVFESRCQKCDSPIVITLLVELKGPIEGTLLLPGNNLLCSKCGAVMTTVVRKARDGEVIKVSSPNILDDEKPKKE